MGRDEQMTREEHLTWCKLRALEYVDRDDVTSALASMFSDLTKHPETRDHVGIKLGMALMWAHELETPEEVRRFIEGFG